MSLVSFSKLLESKKARLQLTQVVQGLEQLVEHYDIEMADKEIVGHLNLTHPSWIEVLSSVELEYFSSLPDADKHQLFERLVRNNTVCLILAGCQGEPSALLVSYARQYKISLYISARPSIYLMWMVRHYLFRLLTGSTIRHGVFLDVLGVGVMIAGESGIGKSELGLELIARGNGFISDDVVELHRIAPDTIDGSCPELLRDFIEVRGLGILNIRTMFGETAVRRKKSLKLIVSLHKPAAGELNQIDRLPLEASFQEILGVNIRTVTIPVVAGRNLAVLVEAAVRNFVMQQRGINSMQEFLTRHDQQLSSY